MTQDEQITALQQRIQEIEAQIAHLQAQRSQTADQSERASIDAQIASLQETEQALEDALSNLQSAPAAFSLARGVTPVAARLLVASHKKAATKDLRLVAANSNKRAKELLKTIKIPKPTKK